MNFQWESLIRAIVPLSFMAIWAVTSLLNRDNKPKFAPPRPPVLPPRPNGGTVAGTRPSEPTLRWGPPAGTGPGVRPAPAPTPARRPARPDDDGIVILASTTRPDRDQTGRPGAKRPSKGKPVVPPRPVEVTPARSKLAGVSQNVNQHLTATTIDMSPIAGMPPVGSMPTLAQGSAASKATDQSILGPQSAVARAIADPVRLREAFLINEILQPPVSLRDRPKGMARR